MAKVGLFGLANKEKEGGFAMELKPALGINIKNYDPADILSGKKWRISEKIDGVRRLFYKSQTGFVSCFSRSGKQDKWLGHITSYLSSPWFPINMVYDCELVDRTLYFEHVDSFLLRAETTGKASQQFQDNKTDLMAICFDMFNPDGDMASGKERHLRLCKSFSGVPLSSPIIMVPCYGNLDGADTETLRCLMADVAKHKGEGLMLMNLETPYIPGRSKELVKVKRLEEFVGKVVDVELANKTTKIAGGIAALICEVNGCTVPVRIGTGFSYDLRLNLAKNSPIGKTIEIDAFSRTKDRNGNISLSMPVFKQFARK